MLTKLTSTQTWDDLALPAGVVGRLRELAKEAGSLREAGSREGGITALFVGPSGTGKTMAAQVLANALAADLYRVDLSAVVSKYVGETEKNLAQVFGAARDRGRILLFDEADALFGNRTEITGGGDRYANLETNSLLQRVEAYAGLAILAANSKQSLDPGFVRRLRYVLDFAVPDNVRSRVT